MESFWQEKYQYTAEERHRSKYRHRKPGVCILTLQIHICNLILYSTLIKFVSKILNNRVKIDCVLHYVTKIAAHLLAISTTVIIKLIRIEYGHTRIKRTCTALTNKSICGANTPPIRVQNAHAPMLTFLWENIRNQFTKLGDGSTTTNQIFLSLKHILFHSLG